MVDCLSSLTSKSLNRCQVRIWTRKRIGTSEIILTASLAILLLNRSMKLAEPIGTGMISLTLRIDSQKSSTSTRGLTNEMLHEASRSQSRTKESWSCKYRLTNGSAYMQARKFEQWTDRKLSTSTTTKCSVNALHIHHCNHKLNSGPAPSKTGDISTYSTTALGKLSK